MDGERLRIRGVVLHEVRMLCLQSVFGQTTWIFDPKVAIELRVAVNDPVRVVDATMRLLDEQG